MVENSEFRFIRGERCELPNGPLPRETLRSVSRDANGREVITTSVFSYISCPYRECLFYGGVRVRLKGSSPFYLDRSEERIINLNCAKKAFLGGRVRNFS